MSAPTDKLRKYVRELERELDDLIANDLTPTHAALTEAVALLNEVHGCSGRVPAGIDDRVVAFIKSHEQAVAS